MSTRAHGSERSLAGLAAVANRAAYDSITSDAEVRGSPHRRHASLRALYAKLAAQVFERATSYTRVPRVLDLGAGDGAVTRIFLELGADVTASDISARQLSLLIERNDRFQDRVEIVEGDAVATLAELRADGRRFDVVSAVSFLHHIPDYLAVVRDALDVLEPHGQLLTFQDALHASSLSSRDRRLSRLAYNSWRVMQPDVRGGFKRYRRRRRGIWLDDCEADNVEFHELRQGLDQHALTALLAERGFDVELTCYFATQSAIWQRVGERLGAQNKFGIVAQRRG